MTNQTEVTPEQNIVTTKTKALVFSAAILMVIPLYFIKLGIGPALPELVTKYNGMSFFSFLLVVTSLCMCLGYPIGGKLGDVFGRRTAGLIGFVFYTLSISACGLAPNIIVFMIGYAGIGLGFGLIMSLPQAVLADTLPPSERPKFFGYLSAVTGGASLVATVYGGWVTDEFGPSYVFLLVIPICIISFVMIWKVCPRKDVKPSEGKAPLDFAGILLLILAVAPLLIALNWGGSLLPWGSPLTIGLLAISLIMFGVFVYVEKRAVSPFINPSLFGRRIFLVAFLVNIVNIFEGPVIMSYFPLYAQSALGVSATLTGAFAIPRTIAILFLPALIGLWLGKRVTRYQYAFLTMGIFMALSGGVMINLGPGDNHLRIYISELFAGCVMAIGMVSTFAYAQRALKPEEIGIGLALMPFSVSLGSALASASFGSVLNARWNITKLIPAELMAALTPANIKTLSSPQVLKNLPAITSIKEDLPAHLQTLMDTMLVNMKAAMGHTMNIMWFTIIGFGAIVAIIAIIGARDKEETETIQ